MKLGGEHNYLFFLNYILAIKSSDAANKVPTSQKKFNEYLLDKDSTMKLGYHFPKIPFVFSFVSIFAYCVLLLLTALLFPN